MAVLWWIPISTPLSERFRNVYFSLFWIVICLFWTIIKDDFITSILPLFIFIYTQIARLIFKYIFKIEPIPLLIYKQAMHRFSNIENRKSSQNDFVFSMLVFIVCSIITITISILYNKY